MCGRFVMKTEPGELADLLVPYPPERMTFYPVNRLVDDPRNDLPACIEPLEEQSG